MHGADCQVICGAPMVHHSTRLYLICQGDGGGEEGPNTFRFPDSCFDKIKKRFRNTQMK